MIELRCGAESQPRAICERAGRDGQGGARRTACRQKRIAVHSGAARLRRWYRLRRDAATETEIVLRHRVAERDPVVTVTFSSTLARYLATFRGFPADGRKLESGSGA